MKTTKFILGALLLVVGAAFIYFFWFAIVGIVAGAFFFGFALLGVFIAVALLIWLCETWVRTCLFVMRKLWELLKACCLWVLNLV